MAVQYCSETKMIRLHKVLVLHMHQNCVPLPNQHFYIKCCVSKVVYQGSGQLIPEGGYTGASSPSITCSLERLYYVT
jgi:hypothetical protein